MFFKLTNTNEKDESEEEAKHVHNFEKNFTDEFVETSLKRVDQRMSGSGSSEVVEFAYQVCRFSWFYVIGSTWVPLISATIISVHPFQRHFNSLSESCLKNTMISVTIPKY